MNVLIRSLAVASVLCFVDPIAGATAPAPKSPPPAPTVSATRLMPGRAITVTNGSCSNGRLPTAVLEEGQTTLSLGALPAKEKDTWQVVLPVTAAPLKAYTLKWKCDPAAKNDTLAQIAVIEVVPLLPEVIGARGAEARADAPSTIELNKRLLVEVRDLKPWRELAPANAAAPLHLYLAGVELPSAAMERSTADRYDEASGAWISSLAVTLNADEKGDGRKAWVQMLRSAIQAELNKTLLPVSVGAEKAQPFPSTASIKLRVFPGYWWQGAVVFIIALACVLVILGKWSSLLRDDNGAANPPYSLARHQMAVWLLVVLGGYLYVWLVTGSGVISNTALILIGVSGATGLAAMVIDNGKRDDQAKTRAAAVAEQASLQELINGPGGLTAQLAAAPSGSPNAVQIAATLQAKAARLNEVDALLAAPAPVPRNSQRWYLDLLSDENGISFHRLQMAVWTVVLVAVFARDVYTELVMPDFDATMLGLMGITSGTYIGFKFPEKK